MYGDRPRGRMIGAPQAFTDVLSTYPQAGSAWGSIQSQLLAENPANATNGVLGAAQSNYANAITQAISSGAPVATPQNISTLIGGAASLVLNTSTVGGAVGNIVNMVQGALSAPAPQAMVQFTGSLISSIVGAEVAAGSVTMGIGAIIMAGIALGEQLLAGVFGGVPSGVNIPNTWSDIGGCTTSNPVGYIVGGMYTSGSSVPGGPLSLNWRKFPQPTNQGDAWWFQYNSPSNTTWSSGDSSDTWSICPYVGWRPIDQAFLVYHQLECEVASATPIANLPLPTSSGGPFSAAQISFAQLQLAYFGAWKANAEYLLNGLQPRTDAAVLERIVQFWNDAHAPGTPYIVSPPSNQSSPGDAMKPSMSPCSGSPPASYMSLLIPELRSSNSPVLDPNGNLPINTGPMAQASITLPVMTEGSGSHLFAYSAGAVALGGVGVAALGKYAAGDPLHFYRRAGSALARLVGR